jgi:hypothetical protein
MTYEWQITTLYPGHTVRIEVAETCGIEHETKASLCLYDKVFIYDGKSSIIITTTPTTAAAAATTTTTRDQGVYIYDGKYSSITPITIVI